MCGGAARAAYYLIGRFLPKYPIPGYKLAYRFRYFLCKHIFESIGKNVLIKRNAYFGDGSKIRIGNNSQIGINSIMDNDVIIGDDVKIYTVNGNQLIIDDMDREASAREVLTKQ